MIGESRTAVKCYNRRVLDRFLVTGGAGFIGSHLLAARAASVGGEVFNVGCGERVSLLAIIAKLETILGRRLARAPAAPSERRPAHARRRLGRAGRARVLREFAIQPMVAKTAEIYRAAARASVRSRRPE